jgi:site-specific DNA recombinase
MRVATYTRISTDEANQPFSLAAQDDRLAAYITSQGTWSHVATYCDQASGATLNRSALTEALADARAGRYDLLLVCKVDRLARSSLGLSQVLNELSTAKVGFCSATEPFDTAHPAGLMMTQMLGSFGEFERSMIIERVIAGMERKAKEGQFCGGHVPVGYRALKGEGRLVVVDDEAPIVGRIFDLYVREHLGSHAIAAVLNEAGHRTRAGRSWSFKGVLTLLRNRTYLGEVSFRGITTSDAHPALVDPEIFAAAQALLAERGEDGSGRAANGSEYLLSGLLRCVGCGRRFCGTKAHGRNAAYRYYTCAGRQRYGTATCPNDRLSADDLEGAVLAQLVDVFEDSDLIERALAETGVQSEVESARRERKRASLQSELTKTESAVQRYLCAFETGSMPEEICGPRLRELGTQADTLRARLARLDAEDQPIEPPSPEQLSELRRSIRQVIETGQVADVKDLLRSLVHEIRITDKSSIQPTYRIPAAHASVGTAVRAPSSLVGAAGLEPTTSAV